MTNRPTLGEQGAIDLSEELAQLNARAFMVCTGAGLEAQLASWRRPGASQYLVGAEFPYARSQLLRFLGHAPDEGCCSEPCALDMAMMAYVRACEHSIIEPGPGVPLGIAVTAAVASTRAPRGGYRAHICIMGPQRMIRRSLELTRGGCQQPVGELRAQHDRQLVRAMADLLQRLAEPDFRTDPQLLAWARAALRRRPRFKADHTRAKASAKGLYLPTSMNPLHDGHRALVTAARSTLGMECSYLVAADTLHKNSPTVAELLEKIAMVRVDAWLQRGPAPCPDIEISFGDPLYIDKARARPGSYFVVGADAALRLLEPHWQGDVEGMLAEFSRLDTVFLVHGRMVDERFVECEDLDIPSGFGHCFRGLRGRMDQSSSDIRATQAPPPDGVAQVHT